MALPDDFCVFILTHGRPGRVLTYRQLELRGYTGKVYIVIDDEDQSREEYIREFGDKVLIFSKDEVAERIDEGSNFGDRRTVTYARNACFGLARSVGCKYFMQLDDDYTAFRYRWKGDFRYTDWAIQSLDVVIGLLLDYYKSIPAATIAMGQAGDWVGGSLSTAGKSIRTKRKAMNTFICSVDREFQFSGIMNEDVNTITSLGRRGVLFLTVMGVTVTQNRSQSSEGGITELYKAFGTYVKSFYSVMYSPSCVRVEVFPCSDHRLHHKINWEHAAPMILHQRHQQT